MSRPSPRSSCFLLGVFCLVACGTYHRALSGAEPRLANIPPRKAAAEGRRNPAKPLAPNWHQAFRSFLDARVVPADQADPSAVETAGAPACQTDTEIESEKVLEAEMDYEAETNTEEQPAVEAESSRAVVAPFISVAPAPTAGRAGADLTSELVALREKIRKALALYYPRHQNTHDNNPWEVMHAMIAYGVDTQLFKGGPRGEKVNAVGWMCYNRPCAGEHIMFLNRGKLDARRGPGVQGHYGQFLAILAQSHVKIDYPLMVGGKNFTLADLVEHEKETCVAGEELTFKLIGLMHYLDSDENWTTHDGQTWSIERLVREELKQPIRGAACGGTHRLTGLSYSVNKRIQRGKPIKGDFYRAQAFIQDYHRYTFSLQNVDGSFSTEWFTRRGDESSIDRRLKTSGHILEWIAFSLPDQELRDPRLIKAVDYVATLLLKHPQNKWEIGPLGHALHSLSIYDSRVFKPADVDPALPVAGQRPKEGGAALEARRDGDLIE